MHVFGAISFSSNISKDMFWHYPLYGDPTFNVRIYKLCPVNRKLQDTEQSKKLTRLKVPAFKLNRVINTPCIYHSKLQGRYITNRRDIKFLSPS